jgi:response regulator RpfG family c-di-GMP phosphodiesterase
VSVTRRNVLVVDDDKPFCELVRITLALEGIEVTEAHHVIQAERLLQERVPDAIVLDIGLPGIDGVFYLRRLRESARTAGVPIVMVSGSDAARLDARRGGAVAFVRKPFDPLDLLAILERAMGDPPLAHAFRPGLTEAEADAYAGDVRRLIEIAHRQHELTDRAYRETVMALATALEQRELCGSCHSELVTAYGMRLAVEVAPSLTDDSSLEWGFLLHDVGKISIPDRILLKPHDELEPSERLRLEQHTMIGEQLLAHVPLVAGEGLRVVRSHHERWDGTGYPDRLKEHDIPIGARLFAVVDALDALTETPPGIRALPWDDALGLLQAGAGTEFDPDMIDALIACEPSLREIRVETLAA